jgi:hypothetical protein
MFISGRRAARASLTRRRRLPLLFLDRDRRPAGGLNTPATIRDYVGT